MLYEWIDEYLMGKPGVTKDLQESWNWRRYHIGGKMFTAEGDVIPGYYSNKQHWNSINPDGAVPDEVLKTMLDRSYELVLKGLPKYRQREILGA